MVILGGKKNNIKKKTTQKTTISWLLGCLNLPPVFYQFIIRYFHSYNGIADLGFLVFKKISPIWEADDLDRRTYVWQGPLAAWHCVETFVSLVSVYSSPFLKPLEVSRESHTNALIC